MVYTEQLICKFTLAHRLTTGAVESGAAERTIRSAWIRFLQWGAKNWQKRLQLNSNFVPHEFAWINDVCQTRQMTMTMTMKFEVAHAVQARTHVRTSRCLIQSGRAGCASRSACREQSELVQLTESGLILAFWRLPESIDKEWLCYHDPLSS